MPASIRVRSAFLSPNYGFRPDTNIVLPHTYTDEPGDSSTIFPVFSPAIDHQFPLHGGLCKGTVIVFSVYMNNETTSPQTNTLAAVSQLPDDLIQVIEEHITVDKKRVLTGKVKIRKTVTEEVRSVDVPMVNEEYEINRVPVASKILDAPPAAIRMEGDETIIPVVREITVVQKKYEVIEEIRISKIKREVPLTHEVTLRKEQIDIRRTTVDDHGHHED